MKPFSGRQAHDVERVWSKRDAAPLDLLQHGRDEFLADLLGGNRRAARGLRIASPAQNAVHGVIRRHDRCPVGEGELEGKRCAVGLPGLRGEMSVEARPLPRLETASCRGPGLQQFEANKAQRCPRLERAAACFEGFRLRPGCEPQGQRGDEVPLITPDDCDRRN